MHNHYRVLSIKNLDPVKLKTIWNFSFCADSIKVFPNLPTQLITNWLKEIDTTTNTSHKVKISTLKEEERINSGSKWYLTKKLAPVSWVVSVSSKSFVARFKYMLYLKFQFNLLPFTFCCNQLSKV